LVLLSFSLGADSGGPRTIDGVALMERMQGNAATGKLKMRLHSPVMFDDPVELMDLPKAFRSAQLLSTSISLRRIPQGTWTELLGQVKRLRPAYARGINRLVEQQFEDHRIFPVDGRTVRLMEQRDAIGTVIDIAGLDRKGILESADTTKVYTASSALELLDSDPLQKQDALRLDQSAFGTLLTQGMRHARFANDRGAEVRVHIYDRKPLESVLGIDLLIYLEPYRAYILVQYKMMTRAGRSEGGWHYPVDQHLRDQLSSMNRVASLMQREAASPQSVGDWRLSDEVFFWKFCEATRMADTEGSLVHGLTLSRPHLAHPPPPREIHAHLRSRSPAVHRSAIAAHLDRRELPHQRW
jgi:hypothetical protein